MGGRPFGGLSAASDFDVWMGFRGFVAFVSSSDPVHLGGWWGALSLDCLASRFGGFRFGLLVLGGRP